MDSAEKILIDLYLKKIGREDLKCDKLYRRSYQAVIDVLEMPEWKEERFAGLLTSNIWGNSYESIKGILSIPLPQTPKKLIWEDKRFAKLLTPNIWNSNYPEVKNILTIPHPDDPDNPNKTIWDDKKFSKLLTSSIWSTSYENISAKLALPFWSNPLYSHLLTSTIWSISATRIEESIKTFEELGLQKYITPGSLRKSSIQIKALYHYLEKNKKSVIVGERLHPVFNLPPIGLKKIYNIDIEELIALEGEKPTHELS